MNNYDNFTVEELRALLRQRDRQLEGERKGSARTLAETERLRKAFDQLNDNRMKWVESHGDLEVENARLREDLKEAESIALWSARRLPNALKTYAYDYIDELFGGKAERL